MKNQNTHSHGFLSFFKLKNPSAFFPFPQKNSEEEWTLPGRTEPSPAVLALAQTFCPSFLKIVKSYEIV